MAVFTGNRVAGVNGTRPEGGDASGLKCMVTSIDVPATYAQFDIFRSQPVPKRSTIVDVTVVTTDLDVNATPTVALQVGHAGDADYWVVAATAATIARSGGVVRASAPTARPLSLTADTTVDVQLTVAPATPAAGSIDIIVYYLSNIS